MNSWGACNCEAHVLFGYVLAEAFKIDAVVEVGEESNQIRIMDATAEQLNAHSNVLFLLASTEVD